jgi:uncharacterized protein
MKKILLSFVTILFFSSLTFAQQKEHKIVFDFAKGDTAQYSMMIRQAKNIMLISSDSKLEIVCHGPGLDLVIKDKTTVQKEIEELQTKFNVVFAACESTMKRRGVEKDQLLVNVKTVPLANLEFSSKQQEGWSYIKAGY